MKILDHFIPVIVDNLDVSIAAYEGELGVPVGKRWSFEAMGLELCVVRPFVLVTAPIETRAELSTLRAVLYVDNVIDLRQRLVADGRTIKWDVDTPVGPAIYVQHAEDMLVEYIQPRDGWQV